MAYNYQIYTGAKNSCGFGTTETLNILVSNHCGFGFKISPNSTTGIVHMSTIKEDIAAKEIRVSDKTGRISIQFVNSIKAKTITVDLSTLPAHGYYLQIFDGTQ